MKSAEILDIVKSLSDETRIQIVAFLIKNGETGCCVLKDMFSLSQPTISHHCSKLERAGVIRCRKEGTGKYYSFNPENIGVSALFADIL